MTLEGLRLRLATAPLHAKPGRGGTVSPAAHGVRERLEPTADMVEHTVEQDMQPTLVRSGNQSVEVSLVTEAGVDPAVIDRVVSVRLRREDGPQRYTGAAEFGGIVEPRL